MTVAAQKCVEPYLRNEEIIDKIITIPDGPLKLSKFPFIPVLREGRHDLLILLYNEPAGYEYLFVDIVGALLPARNKLIHDVDGGFRAFPDLPAEATGRLTHLSKKIHYALYTRTLDKSLLPLLVRAAELYRKLFPDAARHTAAGPEQTEKQA